MKKQLKSIPNFKTDQEEIDFWETHDTTEYFEASKARKIVFPNLKPSTETISIRLPSPMLNRIKSLANSNDVPYQSYLKILLSERLDELFNSKTGITTVHGLHAKGSRA
jgi:predicted DNA binding CopG/RHH family protein